MKKYPFYSIKRLVKAFGYSAEGLIATFKTEAAFKLELLAFIILVPLTITLDNSIIEKILLISSLVLVLITELINSAIEAAIDRISEKKHPLSKKAKDIGSAIVLVALFNAIFVWSIIIL